MQAMAALEAPSDFKLQVMHCRIFFFIMDFFLQITHTRALTHTHTHLSCFFLGIEYIFTGLRTNGIEYIQGYELMGLNIYGARIYTGLRTNGIEYIQGYELIELNIRATNECD